MADPVPIPPDTFDYFATLAELKKHLNIETGFTEDDTYLTSLSQVAQLSVIEYCAGGIDAYDSTDAPVPVRQAILLLAAHLYATRAIVSFAQGYEIPYSFKFLLNPYRTYTVA